MDVNSGIMVLEVLLYILKKRNFPERVNNKISESLFKITALRQGRIFEFGEGRCFNKKRGALAP